MAGKLLFSVKIVVLLFVALSLRVSAQPLHFTTTYLPPFMYEQDGKVAGPGKDIITAVCERQKIACTFELLPWRRAQKMVHEGSANGLFMVGKNPQRERWLRFSPAILETGYGFFSRQKSTFKYQVLSDLTGRCVAVNTPSNMHNRLMRIRDQMLSAGLTPLHIESTTSLVSAFKMVSGGRCELVFGNTDSGRMIIRDHKLQALHAAGDYQAVLYYLGLSRQHLSAQDSESFLEGVQQLLVEGVIQDILASYDMKPSGAYQ
ncbi:MAG: substrate-binding periplasmic protein [Pontibacterium sp.]